MFLTVKSFTFYSEQGLLLQDGQYYTVAPRKEADHQPRRKRRSSFASSTPVPPGGTDDESDGDSGHPLEEDEDDLHNRTHSSVSIVNAKQEKKNDGDLPVSILNNHPRRKRLAGLSHEEKKGGKGHLIYDVFNAPPLQSY